MNGDKNNKLKKETACLFYNFKLNNKIAPILTCIANKKKKISDIFSNIENYYGKNNNLTENEEFSRDSYGYYMTYFFKIFFFKIK